MKKIVLAGGSGFLGQVLARHFNEKGWDAVILTRGDDPKFAEGRPVQWDGETIGPWTSELNEADVLVNLCGKSVNCRYRRRNREAILQSRIRPTRVLAKSLRELENPPSVWLNASSATIYRHSFDTPMDETDGELGHGFSVEICRAWEDAFFEAELPATRRIALRTSMVLGHGNNSVFPILARIARCGMGGKLSHGNQMTSWIHERDFARAIEFAIDDEDIAGPLNLTAPAPVTNSVFMKTLRQSLRIPFGLPHIKPMLEIAAWIMRTETELTLKSRFAIPAKLLSHRFVFNYPFLDEAFENLTRRTPSQELPTEPALTLPRL
ncbi:conserved hypothetical protein TIGR01777 [Verrucomicrobiia bacterium DG1235]|nr:conserved hypothetical protein TIGR01777 [Verrucomicrobiae bacterium DG1235]